MRTKYVSALLADETDNLLTNVLPLYVKLCFFSIGK